MKALLIVISVLLSCSSNLAAQGCSDLGQSPESAFPVCGTSEFTQETVPVCVNRSIPVACYDNADYHDKNPYWYKFTCFTAGTLGFEITPKDLDDDYDWQLFDITGHQPGDVYTNASLFVSGNWSAKAGKTSASSAGLTSLSCAGFTYSQHNKMPQLKQGHQYLLLVSHFTDSQSGYTLSFKGGSAGITDPKEPALESAVANCDATQITVKLNKGMKCSSLAADGSDFVVSSSLASVVSAFADDCVNGFDMNSITLKLSKALPPGNYTVAPQKGKDGNTLLDNCGRGLSMNGDDKVSFTIAPRQPTPMDSITPVSCAPGTIQLVFKNAIRCNSIAGDGSDFAISGPFPVHISSATGVDCSNGKSNRIEVRLQSPVVHQGNYKITLVKGSDGNTIIDECGQETPAGASLPFITKDTVSAAFTYQVQYNCQNYSVSLSHPGGNQVDQWSWKFGSKLTSASRDTTFTDDTYFETPLQLIVSNGFCSDTTTQNFAPNKRYQLKAAFEEPDLLCPEDMASFKNNSLGVITSYLWNFGNGKESLLRTPMQQKYPLSDEEKYYPVQLIVENDLGCRDTAEQRIRVLSNCYIAVPSAFSPNGDGMNDYLYPLNAYKADHLEFRVYNRYGQLVFETKDWTHKWDGRINGQPQNTGAYVWILQYINRDTGKKVFQKGSTLLIR